jgi:hypothetical protein
MAYDPPYRIVGDDGQTIIIFGDCDHSGNPNGPDVRIGSRRYCVTCDAVELGKRVILKHPWRAMNEEEAKASVTKHHHQTFSEIKKCEAVKIPGSCKEA